MLNFGIALLIVICVLSIYAGIRIYIYMKTLDEKIISLYTNGYNLKYIANKLNCDVDYVESVIDRVIYHS
jgi:hypothetical protein